MVTRPLFKAVLARRLISSVPLLIVERSPRHPDRPIAGDQLGEAPTGPRLRLVGRPSDELQRRNAGAGVGDLAETRRLTLRLNFSTSLSISIGAARESSREAGGLSDPSTRGVNGAGSYPDFDPRYPS